MSSAQYCSSYPRRRISSRDRPCFWMAGSPRRNNRKGILMGRKLIDLSMPVHNDMQVFPRVVRPSMAMYETWQQFAERIGAAKYGVSWLTASYLIVLGDHIGTHMDSL